MLKYKGSVSLKQLRAENTDYSSSRDGWNYFDMTEQRTLQLNKISVINNYSSLQHENITNEFI
jgi:hypothetical protein